MIRLQPIVAVLALSMASCTTMVSMESGFLNRTVTIGSTSCPYVVYVPRDFDRTRRWPVILFLHGAGERGSDGLRPTQFSLASAIRLAPARFPAIVVIPQVPLDQRWLGQPADMAMLALDHAIEEFHGDGDRVYLTGLSMGGYGTWHLALAHRDRFAAVVVVCGGLLPHETALSVRQSPLTQATSDPYAFTAHELRAMPLWIFHGTDDTTIPVSEARQMAERLRAEDASFHYTEYAGVGHNSWDRAYGEAELWTWLFAQRRHGGK